MSDQDALLAGYAAEALDLAPRFEALSSKTVLEPVLDHLPAAPARIADIGAGSGRDAAWFAKAGYDVTAVEPVDEFIQYGQAHHPATITWVQDQLPYLSRLTTTREQFDVVLVGSVWHHLDAEISSAALRVLAGLLHPTGILVISLKVFSEHNSNVLDHLTVRGQAEQAGLHLRRFSRHTSHQDHNRLAGNMWDWMVFERMAPEDAG
ncbi:class I SAM-dependent methyltransferase [Phaeobacter porticola]|uniref:Bifunctional 3-demethylubiquinone-9 3-methyltransferase/ 2-octaprenyl-6-hydroxy phenol methylase n=1 Tax=Phaeobacter porticola TaxID=1844006 RepID=A0A1L3I9J7_9RHOB|nr:class I SAM-dependent methyltransferase [Phaeobacter porticola]APG48870.1 bifunctional 3-demethylubiquinone-9 3-methyltransferase/ 2-octaprenyl-6-hydroxy phenol methylase [Phaeobacter porticola]